MKATLTPSLTVAPTAFVPAGAGDFVGAAAKIAAMLLAKATRLKDAPTQPLKLLFSGAPGIGKTSLVNLIARALVAHPCAIEDVNGREVTIETAKGWTKNLCYGSLFGTWDVKVVNELDRCSKDVQDVLLTTLDRMRPGHAFLGTTNLDPESLTERFQTRFQSIRLQPPDTASLAAFLASRWGCPNSTSNMIAECSGGNVRAALADLELWMG